MNVIIFRLNQSPWEKELCIKGFFFKSNFLRKKIWSFSERFMYEEIVPKKLRLIWCVFVDYSAILFFMFFRFLFGFFIYTKKLSVM